MLPPHYLDVLDPQGSLQHPLPALKSPSHRFTVRAPPNPFLQHPGRQALPLNHPILPGPEKVLKNWEEKAEGGRNREASSSLCFPFHFYFQCFYCISYS